MRRRQGKVNRWVIASLAIVAIFFYFLETRSRRSVRSKLYNVKLAGAQFAQDAFRVVRDYRLNVLQLPIDTVNDPNETGLIGVQYSPLTVGRSDLSDALTTTNPNFSAALVEMFTQARLKTGDTVAVNWDGTYPALNIQVLVVAKIMGLYPLIITTQSAGMWGANYPGYTWLDIERVLCDAGFWQFRTMIATLGGEGDDGRGLSPEGRDVLEDAARAANILVFVPDSLSQAVAKRQELFSRCRALVAIGQPVTNSGDPLLKLPSRVLTHRHIKSGSGLVAWFLDRGLPVIHIASPRRVAADYRLPIAPVPLPEIGKGRLFYERRYSLPLAIVLSVILMGLLFIVIRYNVEYYFGVKSEDEQEAV